MASSAFECLGITDLNDLLEALEKEHFSKDRWFELGQKLGLYHSTLKTIEAQYSDFYRRLTECLSSWLRREDNVNKVGCPSHRSLASALRKMGLPTVAKEFEGNQENIIFHVEETGDCTDQGVLDVSQDQLELCDSPPGLLMLVDQNHVEPSYLQKKCEWSFLIVLAFKLKKMEEFATLFQLSESDIEQIQCEKPTSTGRTVHMLGTWRERNGQNATYQSILKLFFNAGHEEIVETIFAYLSDHKKATSTSPIVPIPFSPQKSVQKYPSWDDLQESEKEQIRNELRKENISIQEHFAELFIGITESFEQRNVNHLKLISYLRQKPLSVAPDSPALFPELDQHIDDKINGVFYVIGMRCDWLNYHLLDIVVQRFGSDKDKEDMTHYIDTLFKYLDRSLFEIPPEAIGCLARQNFEHSVYRFVVPDDIGQQLSGLHLKKIQFKLSERMGIPMEHFLIDGIRPGSIILQFSIDAVFSSHSAELDFSEIIPAVMELRCLLKKQNQHQDNQGSRGPSTKMVSIPNKKVFRVPSPKVPSLSSSLICLETAIESVPGAVGLALIVTNDYKGNPSFGNLDATESDGDAMESAFKELGYATIRQHNATLVLLMSVLNKADHIAWPPSCKRLAFVFAGHGRNPRSPDETGTQLVTSNGRNISINTIVKKLSAQSKGSTIGNMVRMFFIDVCLGLSDEGTMISHGGDIGKETRVSINATNYILCFSTLAGFCLYDMKEKGEPCGIWLPLVAEKITTCNSSISDAMTEVNKELMSQFQDKNKYTMMMQPECNQYLTEPVNLLKEKPLQPQVVAAKGQYPQRHLTGTPHNKISRRRSHQLENDLDTCMYPSGFSPAPSLSRTLSAPDHSIAAGGTLLVKYMHGRSPHHRARNIMRAFSVQDPMPTLTAALPTKPLPQKPLRYRPQAKVAVSTNTHVPDLVHPQISSDHNRGLLNQCMQNKIITSSYTKNWSTDEKHDSQLMGKVFRATVKCVLVSDGSIIIGDSKIYYYWMKVAQEMAAKDAYDQIQQKMEIHVSPTPNLAATPTVQAILLPEATTCSVPQPVAAKVTSPPPNRVYKQELNNYFQGQLQLHLPTYKTIYAIDGFQCIISHQHFQSVFGCDSIEGRECRTKKEAENSAAWRVLTLLEMI